ncbi:immunity 22 family protein [Lachnospiraceae bacterium 46-61]
MEKYGVVSLWCGVFQNEDLFNQFIDADYTEDGDYIPSRFEEHFDIDYYDEDFSEIGYFKEKQNDFQKILKVFSNDEIILSKLNKKYNDIYYNSIILLYNFEYSGNVKEYKDSNDNQLHYITCVSYQ